MEQVDFLYWLKGALEMNPEFLEKGMTPEQVKTINDHLNLVFNKQTPDNFVDNLQNLDSSGNPPNEYFLPGTTSKLFCEKFKDLSTKMALDAGKKGLVC